MDTPRTNKGSIGTEVYKKPVKRVTHRKNRPLSFLDKAQRWRQPLIGYICVLPLLAITLLLTSAIRSLVADFTFPTSIWVVAVVAVALVWGVGPTLLMIVLGLLAL